MTSSQLSATERPARRWTRRTQDARTTPSAGPNPLSASTNGAHRLRRAGRAVVEQHGGLGRAGVHGLELAAVGGGDLLGGECGGHLPEARRGRPGWQAGAMPSQVTVRYWAGAQRAAGVESETLSADTVGDLRAELAARPAMAAVSRVASFLVDGVQAGDTTRVYDGAEVDVLPPFAGG